MASRVAIPSVADKKAAADNRDTLYNKSMNYLVDGHNLIPKIGLRLDSLDDEDGLITRLQEFCRLRRAHVEVFFDGAPPGYTGHHQAGIVSAHFVSRGKTADAAMESKLDQLGHSAKNWVVVSSDNRVQQAARACHAEVLSSEEFATLLSTTKAGLTTHGKMEPRLSPESIEEWERLFRTPK